MRKIVFDIETANLIPSVRADASDLELALVGIHDSETDTYSSYTKDELPNLWPILERADLLIGFNSDAFDIPLLNRYYPGDLTAIQSLDILKEVYQTLGRRLRLDTLARATLGRGKIGDGTKSVDWWQQGLVEKVREYCIEDVRLTKELYDFARANNYLKYKDLNEIREIKLDTSSWENRGKTSLTYTLPF